MGFLAKLREGLAKTKRAIFGGIDALLKLFVRVRNFFCNFSFCLRGKQQIHTFTLFLWGAIVPKCIF